MYRTLILVDKVVPIGVRRINKNVISIKILKKVFILRKRNLI